MAKSSSLSKGPANACLKWPTATTLAASLGTKRRNDTVANSMAGAMIPILLIAPWQSQRDELLQPVKVFLKKKPAKRWRITSKVNQ